MSPVPPVPEPRNQKSIPKISLEKPLAKPKQVIHKIAKNEGENNNNDEKKPSIPPKPELLPPSITSRILLESTSKMEEAEKQEVEKPKLPPKPKKQNKPHLVRVYDSELESDSRYKMEVGQGDLKKENETPDKKEEEEVIKIEEKPKTPVKPKPKSFLDPKDFRAKCCSQEQNMSKIKILLRA